MNEEQIEEARLREIERKKTWFYGAVLWFWAILLASFVLAGLSGVAQ